ncbi:hypothetical protein ALC53_02765 [Atta colombica]|uniref:C2H2-type domain-containing protein n=1 Tax=Atta colombica TaxID=520822 RepID=A0A195BQ68_9HYME|nr:hypothetical protein ALC53_02765 [Atta colombica]
MVHPRMRSHDRIHDNSRNYVIVVVAHKSPQLEFSNLPENFVRKLAILTNVTRQKNFSPMKMNKFLVLFSNREPTGKLSPLSYRMFLFPSTRIFLLFLLGRIKKSRLPSRAQMYNDKGRRDVVMGSTGVELDAIFTPDVFLNSRSYRIGSHKLKSTRALAREGTRRALSFRLLLFSVRLRLLGAAAVVHQNVAIRNTANKKKKREGDNFSRDTLRHRDSACNSCCITQFNEKCILNIHERDKKHRGKRHYDITISITVGFTIVNLQL